MEKIIITIPMDGLKSAITEIIRNEMLACKPMVSTSECENGLISRKEAASLLKVSLKTLGQWTKEGVIVGYRFKSRVRYKKEEILASAQKIIASKYRKGFRF